MTTTTAQDFIEHTLDDYLISLAESIQEAQLHLQRTQLTGPGGQAPITYHLPRVDFELKLAFGMTDHPASKAPAGSQPRPAAQRPTLTVRPALPQASGGPQTQIEATSIIKGTFVAVPANGGQPPPVLRCSLSRGASGEVLVTATVRNSLGEPQAGVEVHFNIDPDRSAELMGMAALKLKPGTSVTYGVRVTDANGQAQNTLRVSPEEPKGTIVALVIDALGQTETVLAQGGTR